LEAKKKRSYQSKMLNEDYKKSKKTERKKEKKKIKSIKSAPKFPLIMINR